MKILEHNAGALTNFEVLDLLKSRGAGKDPTRVIASVSASEFKVFDYLEQTPACNQTRDIIHKFVDECKKFDLAKAEILNVVNMRPSSAVEVYTIIEECDTRMEEKIDDFVEMILQVLPAHPSQAEPNEESGEGKEETVQ
ncbi:DNA-directed RNA polymerase III subunit RPC9 isoform X2 [Sesamum indicum]|uniref:DNA-directed RNA polymerase III subunit RPC9 n=1 Tax=Sesamum indicum TaxID=4182 RepID=A0A6I9U288_SESIN|nr:DNA-directed RNA polymerase III subunit RPC9 isoform X2 [Sesamum indicum]XP_011090674.1 DNA-directed RNA polymerase III subunit RPC9 isoform X2 [Sesamum indicum]